MSGKPNAFTAGPTLTWGKEKPKRPDLAPRNSGLTLGDHRTQAERGAIGAIHESRIDTVSKWMRRAGRK